MPIIFGPIISRRFGISLGVDLSPSKKQCNFDCVYCELSPSKTVVKYDDVTPLDELILHTKEALKINKNIDVLTVTANGEPTLYPYLKEYIIAIKPYIPKHVKSLILSNGSLFGNGKVIEALNHFDIVKFSLDSGNKTSFKKVDRINKNLTLSNIMDGIKKYASLRTNNMLVCEVLIVENINDNKDSMLPLVDFLKNINVNRVDLNTIDRPPAYNVNGVSQDKLLDIGSLFDGLFVSFPKRQSMMLKHKLNIKEDEIVDVLKKRPLSIDEISYMFDEITISRFNNMKIRDVIGIKRVGMVDFYVAS